jgi:1-aminocyclopropane-1-carboxylate deaminase
MSTDMSLWFAKLKKRSELQRFSLHNANNTALDLFIKRDDLIDPFISGNKLRKLEGNLMAAINAGAQQLITFGGAYSNHLLASAAAAKSMDFPIIGKVRGEELNPASNAILLKCQELGMQLEFISRTAYQAQKLTSGLDPQSNTWFIPEGGANPEGIWGCQQIYQEALIQNNNRHFDAVFIAQGTTTTSLGILTALPKTTQLFVVPVLKGFNSISEMQALANLAQLNTLTNHLSFPFEQVTVLDEYHHGGYAKTSKDLIDFINFFNQTNQFPIEPTYTGKALYALSHELPKLQPSIKNVLFIHTGGVHTLTS